MLRLRFLVSLMLAFCTMLFIVPDKAAAKRSKSKPNKIDPKVAIPLLHKTIQDKKDQGIPEKGSSSIGVFVCKLKQVASSTFKEACQLTQKDCEKWCQKTSAPYALKDKFDCKDYCRRQTPERAQSLLDALKKAGHI